MCSCLHFFFFCFLSENNHETIISSHCLSPILFGLAELLGEVVWSHGQPPSLAWVRRTPGRLSSRCCRMGAGSHGVEGRSTDAGHGGSRRAPQSETPGKPDFCPALSPSLQILETILPWLSLSCSFWVGGGNRAQSLPWLTGGDAAVRRLSKRGRGINTGGKWGACWGYISLCPFFFHPKPLPSQPF